MSTARSLARPRLFLLIGGLAALAACSSNDSSPSPGLPTTPSTPSTPSTPGAMGTSPIVVTIVPNAPASAQPFQPPSASVGVGGSVHWQNTDVGMAGGIYGGGGTPGLTHTVTADDGSFDSGAIAPNGTFDHVFATAGTFTYHCSIHPQMRGSVVVK